MKVVLDIEDKKSAFILEMLSNFKYVKVEPFDFEKKEILEDIKQGVKELNHIKTGKIKGISINELLDDL